MHTIASLENLEPLRFEQPTLLKRLASSSRALAELKGIAASIPNQGILINTLGLQEAKDSSAIENIVTTHDELFKDDVLPDAFTNASQRRSCATGRRCGWASTACGKAASSPSITSSRSRANSNATTPAFANCPARR